jgi:hypothetical protein
MKLSRLSLIVFAGLLISNLAYGEADAIPSVRLLTKSTDVIVVARASLKNAEQQPLSIDLSIERVIKGDLKINSAISVSEVRVSSSCPRPSAGQTITAIWFLNLEKDGSYRFAATPKNQSCTPFENRFEMPDGAPPIEWQAPSSAIPEDKLAYEIGWSIEAHSGQGPFAAIQNPWIFDGASSATENYVYSRLSQSTSQNAKLLGSLGLIRNAQPNVMGSLGSLVTQMIQAKPTGSLKLNGTERPLSLLGPDETNANISMTAAAISAIVDPSKATVNALHNLILQSDIPAPVIYAASHALANIHTPLAATYLAPMLYGNDTRLRDDAISGIACLANGVPILDIRKPNGGMDINLDSEFKNSETLSHFVNGSYTIDKNADFYLTFWQSWWTSHGNEVQAKANSQ